MKNNNFKERRKFIKQSTLITAALAMGINPKSEAFLGALLRLLFRGTISRATARQTGRILSHAIKPRSKGMSPLAMLGGGSAALWGVIGAVEIKRMWESGQLHALLGREPDIVASTSNDDHIRIEFESDIYQGTTTPILGQTILLPEEKLYSHDDIAVDSLVLGQGILEPGETLSLAQDLSTQSMKPSRYIAIPQIIDLNNSNEVLNFEFGFPDGAAILQLN